MRSLLLPVSRDRIWCRSETCIGHAVFTLLTQRYSCLINSFVHRQFGSYIRMCNVLIVYLVCTASLILKCVLVFLYRQKRSVVATGTTGETINSCRTLREIGILRHNNKPHVLLRVLTKISKCFYYEGTY